MGLCDYGCGREGKFQFKNGNWCCSKFFNSCPVVRQKNSKSNVGKVMSKEAVEKSRKAKIGKVPWNKGKKGSQEAWNKGKKVRGMF